MDAMCHKQFVESTVTAPNHIVIQISSITAACQGSSLMHLHFKFWSTTCIYKFNYQIFLVLWL